MTNVQDHRVQELVNLKLSLRSELRFTPHFEGGEACYLIEDPIRAQFFRVGIDEYLLMSLLDGETTVGEALRRITPTAAAQGLTQQEATAVCQWLIQTELASTPQSLRSERLADNAAVREKRQRLSSWNPVFLKVPLCYPDRFFSSITPWARHAFGPVAALLGLLLVIVAMYQLASSWNAFTLASVGIFSPTRWLWLVACWLLLKIVHETAHGVVCRMYGGSVPEAGAILVLLAPLAYVDLTSVWRFRSKWQRMHTAAAGMYVEIWVAAIATIAWTATQPGLVNDVCFNLVIMASVMTLALNANPLMRFDGYYLLSDLLEIPNLYGNGQQYMAYLGRRYILGESVSSPLAWTKRDIFTRVYGFAAFLWRIMICVSIVLCAATMFHGAGLLIALAAIGLWVGVPAIRLIKHVCCRDGSQAHRKARLALFTAGSMLLGIVACNHLPWPGAQRAPAIVQYSPIAFVRAESPGFLREFYVPSDQDLIAGQPIARLENRQLVAELKDLELAIEQSLLRTRVYKQTDQIHSYQAELEQLRAHQEKRLEKQRQVDRLTVRAPADGQLLARNLNLRLGTYYHEGDEIAAIGDETKKELRIAIAQSAFDQFKAQMNKPVNVRISGGITLVSELDRVVPRATLTAPHQSLYARHGGPLESRVEQDEDGEGDLQLLSPHFTGVILLNGQQSSRIRAGQRGIVWFGRNGQTMGSVLRESLRELMPKDLLGQLAPLPFQ